MKKLFWSAYVVSLILLAGQGHSQTEGVDDFLGLESEILPELKGAQQFTSPGLHEEESWNVDPEKVVIDVPEPPKGQKHSIIPWSSLDPHEWLSIEKWLAESEVKDKVPQWKLRLRHIDHKELMGKVLKCSGTCHVFRGTNAATVQHLSQVKEGDEFTTDKDSIAWVYLMDGSLLRLSPETSVNFQEINIASGEIFLLTRLNKGHAFWHPRNNQPLEYDDGPETDSLSLPLLVKNSNVEHFERRQFGKEKERLREVMFLDERAVIKQIKKINHYRNSFQSPVASKMMMVTPNATIISENASFDFVYLFGGKSYFKKRDTSHPELSLHLRGYSNFESNKVTETKWYEVDDNGRNYSAVAQVPATLQILELLTRRIRTIELARELWLKKFSVPVLAGMSSPETLSKEHGYQLWGNELERRKSFLLEYTRRVETTNLRSLENLLTKVEGKGEKIRTELHEDFYRLSLNDYLLGLKSRYDSKKMRVREMNDVQFHVWMLKNGKF